jgi:hypothetical protein
MTNKINLHKKVLDFLIKETLFRERKNKDRGIVILLIDIYPAMNLPIRMDMRDLTQMIRDAATMDRAWRQILEDRKDLRGADYDQKEIVEQKKQVELGYTPGHDKDVKTLKQVTMPYVD